MNAYAVLSLIVFTFLTVALIWYAWQKQKVLHRMAREYGLINCRIVIQLIMHLQQHRGLSSAWLHGDEQFWAEIQKKRDIIQTLSQQLKSSLQNYSAENIGPSLVDFHSWLSQWDKLKAELPGMQPLESLTRHTALIAALLRWLRETGEYSLKVPLANGSLPLDALVVAFIDKLPALSEALGQARAIGAGAAAARETSAVTRVRLVYYAKRIEELLMVTKSQLQSETNHYWSKRFEKVEVLSKVLLETIEQEILGESITMSSEDYFTLATRAIDSVFAILQDLQNQLGQ